MLFTPPPFMSAGPPPTLISHTAATSNATSASSYTFNNVNIGTASTDRYIIVTAAGNQSGSGSGAMQIASATVAGQACTRIIGSTSNSDPSTAIFITNSPVTSGTTATITIIASDTITGCGIDVFAITNLTSTTAVGTASNTSDNSALSLTTTNNGIAVGISCQRDNPVTCTITNLTESSDRGFSNVSVATGYTSGTTTGSINITFNWTGSSNVASCVASFR